MESVNKFGIEPHVVNELEGPLPVKLQNDDELWTRIPMHLSYHISTWGRVYSTKTSQIIKGEFHKSRSSVYRRIQLDNKRYLLHRLMDMCFELEGEGNEIEHKDLNTLNNAKSNLMKVTSSENKKRMWAAKKRLQEYLNESNRKICQDS